MIDTQEIAVTLRVPVEGDSTRGGLVRGFGGSLRIFFIYGWLNLHFKCILGQNFSILGLIWNRRHLNIRNGPLT